MTVGSASRSASALLNASIMRESSPPDAIFASGFGSSPGFVEIKNSTVSCPWEDSGPRVCLSAKRMPGMFRNSSAAFISLFMAAKPFRRLWVSFSAASLAAAYNVCICAFSSAIFCPDDWNVSSSAAAASRRASSSSTSMPNFCLMR